MSSRVDTRTSTKVSCADQTDEAFDALAPGDDFVLLADHDPTPLRYMLNAERRGQFTWDVEEQGPELWQVRIGKVADPTD